MKSQLKPMGIIFGVALLLRFLLSGIETTLWVDSYTYLKTAEAFASGDWVQAHIDRTPGYPLLIAFVSLLVRQDNLVSILAGINALLGALIPVLVYRLSWRIFGQGPLAFVTGLIAAVLPMPIQYEHSVLSETLYSFSILLYCEWLLRCLNKPWQAIGWLILGLLAGWLMWIRFIGSAVFLATLVTLRNLPDFSLKRVSLYVLGWGILIVSWVGFNAGVHQAPIFSAGSGANQLYKTIDWVNWKSPLESPYKQTLYERVNANPPGRAYRAVNDVHVLMMQSPSNKQVPYSELYLKHDNSARQISQEAMWDHPIQYLVITVKECFKLFTSPDGWDPYFLIGLPLILLSLIGLVFCYHWKLKTPIADKILLGTLGGLIVFNVGDKVLQYATHLTFLNVFQWITLPMLLMVVVMLWLMNRLQPEDEHSWAAYALGLIVIAHGLLIPILTISDSRYRTPLEPLMLLFAAYAASEIWRLNFRHR